MCATIRAWKPPGTRRGTRVPTESLGIQGKAGASIELKWGRANCPVVRPYCIWVTDQRKGDSCRGQSLKKKERKREFEKLLLSGR